MFHVKHCEIELHVAKRPRVATLTRAAVRELPHADAATQPSLLLHRGAAMNGKLMRIWAICMALAMLLMAHSAGRARGEEPVFAQRGYYFTFCRMPEYGLAEWKDIVD